MRRGLILALLLLTAAKPAPPVAPPSPPAPGAGARTFAPVALLFTGFDSNFDLRLDRTELEGGIARAWKAADPQASGSIGLIELSDWGTAWLGDQSAPPGRFDFDRDQDDRVSAAEFKAEFERQFAKFDVNRDGLVTRAEMLQAAPALNIRLRDRDIEAQRPSR